MNNIRHELGIAYAGSLMTREEVERMRMLKKGCELGLEALELAAAPHGNFDGWQDADGNDVGEQLNETLNVLRSIKLLR